MSLAAEHIMQWRARGISEDSPATRHGPGYDGDETGEGEIGEASERQNGKDFVPDGI